jgi:hypothetical protein
MFFKLLTLIAVVLAGIWLLVGGRAALSRGGSARTPARVPAPRTPRADDLVSCGRCGVWLPAGQRCDCAAKARTDGA